MPASKIDTCQMESLRKALRLPRVNLFIADDTALGKRIGAGLIGRELLPGKKAKTIVVPAPPSVLEPWRTDPGLRLSGVVAHQPAEPGAPLGIGEQGLQRRLRQHAARPRVALFQRRP